MPEYTLPNAYDAAWDDIDEFTQGYIEAAFFTSAGPDDGDMADKGFTDLAPETLAAMIADCAKFQADNSDDLDEMADTCRVIGYDMASAGRDFWFTRNGHGVGFWDRDAGDIGDKLTQACRAWSTVDLYLGDDGKVYA